MRGTRQYDHGGSTIFNSIDDQLWEAVGNRDLRGVQAALRAGADVNMICSDGFVREECAAKKRGVGRTLLHHAAWAGDLEVFRFIVEQGGDVSRKRNTAWRPGRGSNSAASRGGGRRRRRGRCMARRGRIRGGPRRAPGRSIGSRTTLTTSKAVVSTPPWALWSPRPTITGRRHRRHTTGGWAVRAIESWGGC